MPSLLTLGQPLPTEIENLNLLDRSGSEVTLGSLLGETSTILILLRHFGCIACSEHVNAWIPHLNTLDEKEVNLSFIGNGQARYIEGFVERHQLADKPVTILTNPSLSLYNAAGMVRSVSSNLRLTSIKNAMRAFSHGNRQVSIEGNPNQQGGILLFDNSKKLTFIHREKGLGNHLPVATILAKAGQ